MLPVYKPGINLEFFFDLEDENGEMITPQNQIWLRYYDEQSNELDSTQILLIGDAAQVPVSLNYQQTALPEGEVRMYRRLELTVTSSMQTFVFNKELIIEDELSLLVGENSFQSYGEAALNAREVSNISNFENAERQDATRALSYAYQRLGSLRFRIEGDRQPAMTSLTAAQLAALDPRFLKSLKLAQLVEADESLNPNSIHKKRIAGLMAETIGESSMMFRPEKVMNNSPLTRRSMILLSEWIDWTLPVGRA